MHRIFVLLTLTFCSCVAQLPTQPTTVFPSHTLYPARKNLPPALIADLPKRIRALPATGAISISSLVRKLGLASYRTNVSANLRWNTFFMHLDSDHILYMRVDTTTIPEDQDLFSTPWAARVTTCQLMRNPYEIVCERVLAPSP
jgi:hypothetical protein